MKELDAILMKISNRIPSRLKSTNSKISYSKPISDLNEGNQLIREYLSTSNPLLVGRIGASELKAILNYLDIKNLEGMPALKRIFKILDGHLPVWNEHIKDTVYKWSGVFPIDDKSMANFSSTYIDAINELNIVGVWSNANEGKILNDYCPNAHLIKLPSIEPYYFKQPWSINLLNKRVLIIHPFESTIIKQYKNREHLFENKDVLPDFKLVTLKAVQSIAYNNTEFKTWNDALDNMKSQINKLDFDIALIGAGAYGLPLAAHVKRSGKQAIHMGGALQLLFGIRGGRWDNNLDVNKFYNEYWTSPLPEETPEGFKKVEEGCYW